MQRFFRDEFVDVFSTHFDRLYRYLDRLSGDPDLAADTAQEAFVKLYERGAMPDSPGAWLVTVAMNLLRNTQITRARRIHLLKVVPEARTFTDRSVTPVAQSTETAAGVRAALDRMPERERKMLLLRAEGYNYREIAAALNLNEASVGTLLARAKRAFLEEYEKRSDASQ